MAATAQVERPVLELSFRYGSTVLAMDDPRDRVFVAAGAQAQVMARHAAAEREACRLLESFGAVELEHLDDITGAYGSTAHYLVCVDDDVHGYCSFGAYALPQLRKLGFKIDVADDYPYPALSSDTPWYARFEGDDEGHDWFSLELGIQVEGERIDMLPALLELLRSMGDDTPIESIVDIARRYLALPVPGGSYVPMPAERLSAMLRVVRDLYDPDGAQQRLRFHRDDSTVWDALGEPLEDEGLGNAPILWEGADALRERASRLTSPPPPNSYREPGELRATLRPYQREGVAWLTRLRQLGAGGVLADDMGLGKTLQTIASLVDDRQRGALVLPALIVAPTSLVGNWQREIAKFAPTLRTTLLYGKKRHARFKRIAASQVAITSYTVLRRDLEKFLEHRYAVVVLDEAQTIKNPSSGVHKAACRLDADARLCLTGTPLENHLGEVHALFDFLMPGVLGSAEQFRHRYRIPIEMGDEQRLDELRRRVEPFILRRMKSEVATDLPEKTEIVRAVDLDDDQRDLYESIRLAAHQSVRHTIREKGLAASTVSVLDALTKLRLACCHPRLVKMLEATKVKRSAKLEVLLDLIDRLRAEGRRALVFSQFTSMLALISEALLARGVRHLKLTGASTERSRLVDAFQRGDADVFLISLKAGGTGLTLTRADTVIHYDPWWNPAAQAQATDRAYRIGQTEPVFVYKLIVAGSVEERMMQLQARKHQLAEALLSTTGGAPLLQLDELDDLFAPLDG